MAADLVVSTSWLAEHLHDSKVRVVDVRGYVVTRPVAPGVEEADYRGARAEYLAGHIPGAVYVDWTSDIIDPDDPVPVQIAPPDRFAEAMAVRGIGDDTLVVAVDHAGGQFATRLWWTLSYYGHDSVRVLDGGWNAWVNEERAVEAGEVTVARADFTAEPQVSLRATAKQLAGLLHHPDLEWQLVDARDEGQFRGDRRRGARGGHIPGALNLPRERFFRPEGGFLPIEEIRAVSMNSGFVPIGRQSPIVMGVSRRRSFSSTWPGSVIRISRTTTAPGMNGEIGPTCPSSRESES